MDRRALLAAVGTGSLSLVTGCAGAGGSDAPSVRVNSQGFVPRETGVEVGATVTWTNRAERKVGQEPVTVTAATFHDSAAEWPFDETLEEREQTASHTFEEPGVYEYYSKGDGKGSFCGVVLVGDASLDGSLPCV